MAEDFWRTLKGLLTRIADISHNFTWSSLNTATKDTVKERIGVIEVEQPERKFKLYWETMGDERVCLYCVDHEGEYEPDEPFLPVIPAHPLCRCWWNFEEVQTKSTADYIAALIVEGF